MSASRVPLDLELADVERWRQHAPMADTITVANRFCGPPDSGNGGYVCGLLGRYVVGDAEVTLRHPPPLERPLTIEPTDDGGAVARDGDDVVAEAVPTTLDIVLPAPVTVDDAQRAAAVSPFLRSPEEHPFPTCFVCGPNRAAGDGLRLFATPVPGRDDLVGAAWTPDASLPRTAGDDTRVADEIVWSALDCPSSFSMYLEPRLEGPYVLGRLAAHLERSVSIGGRYVVVGWRVGVDRRKLFAGSALFDGEGVPVAFARATWVRLKAAA
jgi:hypothetical protein